MKLICLLVEDGGRGGRVAEEHHRQIECGLLTFSVTGIRYRWLTGNILSATQQVTFDDGSFVFQLTTEGFVVILKGGMENDI